MFDVFVSILIIGTVGIENHNLHERINLINQALFISQQAIVQNFSNWLILIYFLIDIIKSLKSHDLIQQQILHDAENVRVTRLSILPIMH